MVRRWLSVLTALFLAGAVVFVPQKAFADDYSCPSTHIMGQVKTDGTIDVIERSVYQLEEDTSELTWRFTWLPYGAEVRVNFVRYATLDEAGNIVGDWVTLPSAAFSLRWRDEGRPSKDAYSFDEPRNTLYAFFTPTDSRMIFELDYAIINGAQAYEDIAEVNWTYVASDRDASNENVELLLALPVPFNQTVVPGETVMAWGHGPEGGEVAVNSDGTVLYTVPYVGPSQSAVAHVLFPETWLTNLNETATKLHRGQFRQANALDEESTWVDSYHARQKLDLGLDIFAIVLCIIALGVGGILFYRYSREVPPDFTRYYFDEMPDDTLPLPVVARLWHWNRKTVEDTAVAVMDLQRKGVLRLERSTWVDAQGKSIEDYQLQLLKPAAALSDGSLERATVHWVFGVLGERSTTLTFNDIRKFARTKPTLFQNSYQEWQRKLTAAVAQADLFDQTSQRVQLVVGVMAAAFIVMSLIVSHILQNTVYLWSMLATGVMLGVLANYLPRRTQRGCNVIARCKALRHWLEDYPKSAEEPLTDSPDWEGLMICAYLFDIDQDVMARWRKSDSPLPATPITWEQWHQPHSGTEGGIIPDAAELWCASIVAAREEVQRTATV